MDPTPSQIEEWKKQYGSIYQVDQYIFRAISIGDYQFLATLSITSAELEERIALAAILFPEEVDLDHIPAGVISQLAEEVTNISGFGNPKAAKRLIERRRQELDNIFTLAKAIILTAMPAYSEEDLDTLSFTKLVDKVVLAESIFRIHNALNEGRQVELELLDPEEEAAKAAREAIHHNAGKRDGQAVHGDPVADRLRRALQG